jgi:hypothetical protein
MCGGEHVFVRGLMKEREEEVVVISDFVVERKRLIAFWEEMVHVEEEGVGRMV